MFLGDFSQQFEILGAIPFGKTDTRITGHWAPLRL
jgi:hypothetical protein